MKKYTKQKLLDAFDHYADCQTIRVDHEENDYLENTMSSVMFVTLVEKLFYEIEMGVMQESEPKFKIGDRVFAKFDYETSSTGSFKDGTEKQSVECDGKVVAGYNNDLIVESISKFRVASYQNNGLMGTNCSRNAKSWYEIREETLKSPLSAILNAL